MELSLNEIAEEVEDPGPLGGDELWLLATQLPDGGAWLQMQVWSGVHCLALLWGVAPRDVMRTLSGVVMADEEWAGSVRETLVGAAEAIVSARARSEVDSLLARVSTESGPSRHGGTGG